MKQDDDAIQPTLGDAIRFGRIERGLSQRALATKITDLGVPIDATAITRLENNQREPRLNEALALSRYLGFDLFLYAPPAFATAGRLGKKVATYSRDVTALSKLINDGIATFGVDLFLDEVQSEVEFDDELHEASVFVASFLMATSRYGPLVDDPSDGAMKLFLAVDKNASDDEPEA